jgi:hypothetical protein
VLNHLHHLENLQVGTFDPLSNTRLDLDMRGHSFKAFDQNLFRNLTQLRSLGISGQNLGALNPFMFKDLLSLQYLEAGSENLK